MAPSLRKSEVGIITRPCAELALIIKFMLIMLSCHALITAAHALQAPQLADTVRAPSLGPALLARGELPPGQSEAGLLHYT